MAHGTVRIGSTALDPTGTPTPAGPRPGTLTPGSMLDGRYRVLSLLGTGGMGSVYRAEHEAIGRTVAVKVLHPEHCNSPAERERFRREARVAVRLRSPYVVETLDFGEDAEGRLFLVMELLEGEPVRAVLAREGHLAPERVARLLRQLLAGLDAAHSAGIIHRDLKPENLWLDGSGSTERLRLLDFGIAKWTGATSGSAQTQAGLVVGTPEYLAPEQAVGGEVDHRADLYSTGVLTFVLLTGRHPFDTRDVRALLAAHAYRAVPSPSSLMPELAAYPRLLEFVARATEKDRDKRPGSARELLQLLEGAEFPVRLSRSNLTQSRNTPSGLAAARASLLGIPAARMPDVVNVTLVQVHIASWDSWAPATSPRFRALHLAAHDARVLPLVRAYGGRRVLAQGGASLFVFRSPTDAVHCAAALQANTTRGAESARDVERLELQIGVHQGEVHLARRPAGAPLATVRALSEDCGVGEVLLTRGVYLTMSRSEAPAEEMGPRSLAGLSEPVATYRLVHGPRPEASGGARINGLPRPAHTDYRAGILSIQVAGETEPRVAAVGRVLAASAALAVVRAMAGAAGALHALVYRAHLALRPGEARSRTLDQLLAALERARRLACAHEPELVLAVRRPLARASQDE
jgi:serine/threonine-protein kinase